MINYSISFAVMSRSDGGHGKLAWRTWRVTRSFENSELARLPSVGDSVMLAPTLHVTCVGVGDSFGWRTPAGKWNPAIPVTTLFFNLVRTQLQVSGVGCYELFEETTNELRERLNKAGFDVSIDHPLTNQTPTETPPPKPGE